MTKTREIKTFCEGFLAYYTRNVESDIPKDLREQLQKQILDEAEIAYNEWHKANCNPINLPRPLDYYEAVAEGWNYQRNGIGGRGFWSHAAPGGVVVELNMWNDAGEPLEPGERRFLKLPVEALSMPVASTHLIRHWRGHDESYEFVYESTNGPMTTTVFRTDENHLIVLFVEPFPDDDRNMDIKCVFDLESAVNGDISESWRGDVLASVAAVIREQRNGNDPNMTSVNPSPKAKRSGK